MEPLAPLLAAGGVLGLFSAAAALVIQLFRQNTQLGREREDVIRGLREDVSALKAENASQRVENYACRVQVNGLCGVLRENGIPIPDWLIRGEPA